ncbi:TIGR04438 family Trp-rich protein [Burkholderiaceae bacterium FT117]|uniref:TIGR04438 family Trp-rich protein n=1 Tax=Zeimonas sediminis TaxID=2944268 RepID=UPI002342FD02|nr:TIGR04438 family Trp-rich protein [Zeimonas sediminis]MCM5572217.1 TIGR04438 family Trp-rich protein [Zeimonas sediminis]
MPFVWTGVLLLALRAFGIEPVSEWSWGWILAPFACAFVWFEIVEPLFGLDRVADPGEALAETRRKRIEAMFPHFRFRRRPVRSAATTDDGTG